MSSKYLVRECERCGTPYKPTRSWQRFCQTKCAMTTYNETHGIHDRVRAINEQRRQERIEAKKRKEKKGS